jgi:hypothetical protein
VFGQLCSDLASCVGSLEDDFEGVRRVAILGYCPLWDFEKSVHDFCTLALEQRSVSMHAPHLNGSPVQYKHLRISHEAIELQLLHKRRMHIARLDAAARGRRMTGGERGAARCCRFHRDREHSPMHSSDPTSSLMMLGMNR